MEKAFKKEVLNVQVAPLHFVGEKLIFFNFAFLVFLIFFSVYQAQGQNPLDFECVNDNQYPCYWEGNKNTFSLDTIYSYTGKNSLVLNSGKSFSFLSQKLFYQELKKLYNLPENSEIKITGRIKTNKQFDGSAFIWLRLEDENGPYDLDNTDEPIVNGAVDWEKVVVSLPIKENTLKVYFGLGVRGAYSTAYFDDIEIFINDKPVNPYLKIQNHSKSLRKIQNSVHAFTSKENKRSAFSGVLDKSKIIGLGDCSHGTAEFTLLKKDVLEYLTQHGYPTDLAIECHMAEAKILNDFVHGRNSLNKYELLSNISYWLYQSDEFYQLLLWIKGYNAKSKTKINVWGIDIGNPYKAVDHIERFYAAYDADNFNEILEFKSYIQKNGIHPRQKVTSDTLLGHISTFKEKFEKNYAKHAKNATGDYHWALRNIQLLYYHFGRSLFYNSSYSSLYKRDQYMFENTKWIVDNFENKLRKLLVWAHNGHVGRHPKTLGAHLGAYYGKSYQVMATFFSSGTYLAKSGQALQAFESGSPKTGSLESFLDHFASANHEEILFFDINKYGRRHHMFFARNIGSSNTVSPFFLTDIRQFDYIIHYKRTNALSVVH